MNRQADRNGAVNGAHIPFPFAVGLAHAYVYGGKIFTTHARDIDMRVRGRYGEWIKVIGESRCRTDRTYPNSRECRGCPDESDMMGYARACPGMRGNVRNGRDAGFGTAVSGSSTDADGWPRVGTYRPVRTLR